MDTHTLADLLAGQMYGPAALFLLLLFATFALEDAATIAAGLLASQTLISPNAALIAVLLGTILGDLALYAIGRWFKSTALAARLCRSISGDVSGRLRHHGLYAVIAARFLPGTRLPTFTAAGILRLPFAAFCIALIGPALIWTPALFYAGSKAGQSMLTQLTPLTIFGAASLLVLAAFAPRLIMRTLNRKAETHASVD